MTWVNLVVGAIVGAVLFPFRHFPPVVGLGVMSLLVAVGMLLVFRAVSDQAALAAVKRRIHGGLLEMRLFNDDLRAMFRAMAEILRANVTYLRLSVAPRLWIAVPLVLLVAQLQFYYACDGLEPDEHAIVKVRVKDAAIATATTPDIALEAPSGLRVETPAVWIPSEREVAWRVAADQQGDYELIVTLGGRAITKRVRVSNDVGWRIEDDVPIESIQIEYPPREVNLLGWHTHWMVAFFLLSIAFALALRSRVGVIL